MRSHDKCVEIMGSKIDLNQFSDEIAISFLNNGDVEELDALFKYLVELGCVSFILKNLKTVLEIKTKIFKFIFSFLTNQHTTFAICLLKCMKFFI